jgi:hypothetical protein
MPHNIGSDFDLIVTVGIDGFIGQALRINIPSLEAIWPQ